MDGLLKNSRMMWFLGKNYKDKAEFLKKLGVPGLASIRDFVIDPRNDIEHEYQVATKENAERAIDIADLFLGATDAEARIPAIMSWGWSIRVWGEVVNYDAGRVKHGIGLECTKESKPMLLIHDYWTSDPKVLVIIPKDEAIQSCPLKEFRVDQLIELHKQMRQCLRLDTFQSRDFSEALRSALKDQAGI